MMRAIVTLGRALCGQRRGSVSVLGALSLLPMIGMVAVTIELGMGYQAKVMNQSVADAAALAASNAYATTPTDAMLVATAGETANANGIATSNVSVAHLTNYGPTAGDVVKVVVTKTVPIYFGKIFSSRASYTVSTSAIATLGNTNPPPCVIALDRYNLVGVSQLAATTLSAPLCAVQSNSSVIVAALARMTAKMVTASDNASAALLSTLSADKIVYGKASIALLLGTVTGTKVRRANSIADPLVANAGIAAARALLGSAPAPSSPAIVAGNDLSLNATLLPFAVQGVTATLVNGAWTLPAGTYNFRNLAIAGTRLVINGPSTVNVSGTVSLVGGSLTIGDGTVLIKGQTTIGLGSTVTIGAGRHYFGPLTVNTGSRLTVGAGDLDVNGLLLVSDLGTTATLGAGRYTIGKNLLGTAINLGTGASLSFGSGQFSADGDVITAVGSSMQFGAAANHVIDGMLSVSGTTDFGAGSYIVDGMFTNNAVGTVTGSNVSFVTSGPVNATLGSGITLSAPMTNSGTGIREVLFASSSALPTLVGGGPQDNYSGAIYSPNAPMTLVGGASSSGTCLMFIAQSVLVSLGTAPAAACPTLVAPTPAVALVR